MAGSRGYAVVMVVGSVVAEEERGIVGGRDALSSGSGKSERRETSQARQRQGGFLDCHREDGESEHG